MLPEVQLVQGSKTRDRRFLKPEAKTRRSKRQSFLPGCWLMWCPLAMTPGDMARGPHAHCFPGCSCSARPAVVQAEDVLRDLAKHQVDGVWVLTRHAACIFVSPRTLSCRAPLFRATLPCCCHVMICRAQPDDKAGHTMPLE